MVVKIKIQVEICVKGIKRQIQIKDEHPQLTQTIRLKRVNLCKLLKFNRMTKTVEREPMVSS